MTTHNHIPFIIAAYSVATVVIGAMIGMIVADHRQLVRQLARVQPRVLREGKPASRR
ncbi:MAG: heme exporter protein CcmD [Hyphomicrobiales bacterium]|nr:heme exporter protein CcmD [Hyphomicrobiales bacterium]